MVTVDRTYALPVYLQTCRILASGGFHSTEDHVNMRLVWTRCKVLFKTIIKHASAIFHMKKMYQRVQCRFPPTLGLPFVVSV